MDDLFELTAAAFEAANRKILGTKRIKKGRSAKWFASEIKQELQAAQEDYTWHRQLCKDANALPEDMKEAAVSSGPAEAGRGRRYSNLL